jgi:hypothetical protein
VARIHILTALKINGSPKSDGAKQLIAALVASFNGQTTFGTEYVTGALNVGWGRGGGDLNKTLPPNKLHELQKCKEAGVPTVLFAMPGERVAAGLWFGRNLRHTRGLDIQPVTLNLPVAPMVHHCLCNSCGREYIHPDAQQAALGPLPQLPVGKDFYTAVVAKQREYRVHVFDGLAVRSGTKRKESGEFTDTQPIWNLDHGFQIRYEHSAPVGAKEVAKAAVKALELDFAAVDVIEDANGHHYVLEVNCRPGLHGNTVVKYAEKIIARAGG